MGKAYGNLYNYTVALESFFAVSLLPYCSWAISRSVHSWPAFRPARLVTAPPLCRHSSGRPEGRPIREQNSKCPRTTRQQRNRLKLDSNAQCSCNAFNLSFPQGSSLLLYILYYIEIEVISGIISVHSQNCRGLYKRCNALFFLFISAGHTKRDRPKSIFRTTYLAF